MLKNEHVYAWYRWLGWLNRDNKMCQFFAYDWAAKERLAQESYK